MADEAIPEGEVPPAEGEAPAESAAEGAPAAEGGEGAEGGAEGAGPAGKKKGAAAADQQIDVTTYEIKQFRTSISARRFPALRELEDDDIAALILADKVAKRDRPWSKQGRARPRNPSHPLEPKVEAAKAAEVASRPQTGLRYMSEANTLGRMPFSPCNPTRAKNDIFLGQDAPYALCQTEYEGARNFFIDDKQRSLRYGQSLNRSGFLPAAPSQAKDQIRVKYFLNSADAETLEREKSDTLSRSLRNKSSFLGEHATLVRHYKNTGEWMDDEA
mmetsp:Transcript_64201/g.203081  ORF Transcript_64201/g.203081 Transcript_64201/m.203081 type:complete len:274 (-) Transcript_64201:173-994(-)